MGMLLIYSSSILYIFSIIFVYILQYVTITALFYLYYYRL